MIVERCTGCGRITSGEHTCPNGRADAPRVISTNLRRCACGHFIGKAGHACPRKSLFCPNGHSWSETESMIQANGGMGRSCTLCLRERSLAKRRRKGERPRGSVSHYMGDSCVNGHRKTLETWRHNGHNWFCVACRSARRARTRQLSVRSEQVSHGYRYHNAQSN